MRVTHLTVALAIVAVGWCIGCDEPTADGPRQQESEGGDGATVPAPTLPETPTESELSDTEGVLEKAEVGIGRRGRDYGGGIITEPIRQYFRAQDRIELIKMENGMRTFKTLNGRVPKSQEEFMKEIIKANAVKLPELPDGDEYIYDPEQGELMVQHPE